MKMTTCDSRATHRPTNYNIHMYILRLLCNRIDEYSVKVLLGGVHFGLVSVRLCNLGFLDGMVMTDFVPAASLE